MWWSEANIHVLLAKSNSYRPHLEPSVSQSLSMGCQSCRDVIDLRIKIDIDVPKSFSDDAGSLCHFLFEGMLIGEFTPHAWFSTDDIDAWNSGFITVHFSPIFIHSVDVTVEVSEADVKIGNIVVWENDFIFAALHSGDIWADSPPFNHIFILHGKVDIFICPINHFLFRRDSSPQFFLLLSIVNRKSLVIRDSVGLHPVSDALSLAPAIFNNLVSSEVDVIVLESVVDVWHDILYYFPSEGKGGVELSHVNSVASQSDLFVFLTPSPRLGVGWWVDFWNNTNASNSGILDDLFNVGFGEDSPNAAVLTQFRDIWDLHGERILIDDVPMQHVQLRVKHMVESLDDLCDRKVVSGRVDHQSAPLERRGIFNFDW